MLNNPPLSSQSHTGPQDSGGGGDQEATVPPFLLRTQASEVEATLPFPLNQLPPPPTWALGTSKEVYQGASRIGEWSPKGG